MRYTCLVLLVLFIYVDAGNVWLKDLISPKGWELGYGVILKLNESRKGKTVPVIERLSLDLNFGDLIGVRVGKARSGGVDLNFFTKKNVDYQEGRGKKGGDDKQLISMIIGYKAAVIISIMFGIMKMLTMKAIFIAKAALIMSFFAMLMKLKNHHPPEIIEVEQHGFPSHAPYYVEKDHGSGFHGYGGGYGGGFGDYNYGKEAQPSHVYQDIVYAPSAASSAAASELNPTYSPGTPNDSAVPVSFGRKRQDLERRRDNFYFRKMKGGIGSGSVLSIKKYSNPNT